MAVAGRQAVAARDTNQAQEIAWAIRRVDPANVEAETILTAAQRVETIARLAKAHFAVDEPPAPGDAGTVKDDELTAQVEAEMQIRTERLTKEVRGTIEAARRAARTDADTSLSALKRLLNTVTSSTDIDPVAREKLRKQVQRVIDEVQVVKMRVEQDQIRALERRAALQARQFAIDELTQKEDQLERLIDQVRTLLYEGFSGRAQAFEDAEAVARAAWELAPYRGVTAAAIFNTEAAGQLDKVAVRLRNLRNDRFLATLYSVELSHVPIPDEPHRAPPQMGLGRPHALQQSRRKNPRQPGEID
jgi:hypothetical protein